MIYSFKTVITRQLTTEQRVFVVKHWFITRSLEQVCYFENGLRPRTSNQDGDLEKFKKILRTVLTVIPDILGARELVDPRKILIGYKNYWQIIQEELAVAEMVYGYHNLLCKNS